MVDPDLSSKNVGAVAKAAAILRTLARSNTPAGVSTIARDSGVSVSGCFNILRALAEARCVSFDPQAKTYQIGMRMLELSQPLLGADQAELIRPRLEQLSDAHASLICLWQITQSERIRLVARVATAKTARIDINAGARLPAFVGAVGRCYAASRNLPQSALKSRFEALRWQVPPGFEAYMKDVEQARRDGYAFDFGHLLRGLTATAAIVSDASGTPQLGISGIGIIGQLQQHEIEALGIELRDTADFLGEALFGVSSGARQAERRLAGKRAAVRMRQNPP